MGHYTQLFEAYGLGVGQVLLTAMAFNLRRVAALTA